MDQCQLLCSSGHWDALLDYVILAWNHVRETPVWDNPAHNAVRKHCFKILSYNATTALKHGLTDLGRERVQRFQLNVKDMIADCEDINDCTAYLSYLSDKM